MNKLTRISILALAASIASIAAFAQTNTVVQTSLSAAITANQTTFAVASATGISAPTASQAGSALWIQEWGQTMGELAQVSAISGTSVTVRRASTSRAHASGAMVLVATVPNWFAASDPRGSCVTATTGNPSGVSVTPWLNTANGNQWLCSTISKTWTPGFGNTTAPPTVTTAVASAAGLVTPSGPLFHITGTLAITGFNIPVGYNGGTFCAIPDGAFTTTTANNIALASTAVASKVMCFSYDQAAAKPFFPSY